MVEVRWRSRWPGLALVVAVVLLAVACGGGGAGSSEGDGESRRVLVDFKHDEFSASFLAFFPNLVTVHPGDRVDFKQAWTGEPHSVTMGRLVDELGKPYWDLLDPVFERGDANYSAIIGAGEPEAPEFFEKLPFLADEALQVLQAVAQPCYIEEGGPDVSDPDEPCEVQEQPEFNGRYDYYNSGFIPYQGERGNTFTVPIAEDIEPGTYHYYCNWHFVEMSGAIRVVPESEPIPSQTDVNKEANRQASRYTDALAELLDEAEDGERGDLPVVGFEMTEEENETEHGLFPAFGNEFVPSTVEAEVGEEVTWTFVGGAHSLAFNVPEYFPVFDVGKGGKVSLDQRGFRAVGFPKPPDEVEFDASLEAPPPEEEGEAPPDGGSAEGEAEAEEEPPPREPVHLDGGRFDGSGGLRSTGMFYSAGDTFSLTFTKSGTYLFACLVHPAMVGKVDVS
jgi:plastocyanin